MTIGSLILLVVALTQQKIVLLTTVPPQYWLPISGSVVLLSGYVSFLYRAIAKAPVTLVTSLLILATPITTILSTGLLRQHITTQTLVPQIVTIIALAILVTFRSKAAQKTA
jgi:drug/metabolite transporter (DMT)-like permease